MANNPNSLSSQFIKKIRYPPGATDNYGCKGAHPILEGLAIRQLFR